MNSFFWRNLLFFISFIFISENTAYSQNNKFSNIKMSAKYHYGYFLPEYPFFDYLVNDNINVFEYNIQKEVSGKNLWHKVYKYPSTGISLFYSELGNNSIFGKTVAINPYIQFNLLKKEKIDLRYQLGFGICYVTHHFDFQENYHNIAVGSHLNIWLNSELTASYHFYNDISLLIGTAFNHLSNANLAEPNIGLNSWTFFSGIQANINKKEKIYDYEIPKFNQKNEYSVIIAGGIKQTRRFAEEHYFSGSISLEYKRKLGHKFSIGAGSDLFFDASVPDEMIREGINDVKNLYKYKNGFHLSQEFIFGKISLIFQEGLYFFLTDHLYNHKMYNRGILRYKFSDHFFVNIAMKSNIVVLDVMEIGVGYCWN